MLYADTISFFATSKFQKMRKIAKIGEEYPHIF